MDMGDSGDCRYCTRTLAVTMTLTKQQIELFKSLFDEDEYTKLIKIYRSLSPNQIRWSNWIQAYLWIIANKEYSA